MSASPVNTTSAERAGSSELPILPAGQIVRLPGRGGVFVRHVAGPSNAPVVALLHGWTTTADLNWHTSYQALGRHFRVIAFDHRGHGRGLRSGSDFRLEDCADDVVAVAAALGIEQFIPVGYSMGGPIAKLIWRRHPRVVDGLVLCATSSHFADSACRRVLFTLLNGTSALASTPVLRALSRLSGSAMSRRLEQRGDAAWMVEQVLRHDWTQVLEAGRAIGQFDARPWTGEIDVPTAVDEIVPTMHQYELSRMVPGASLHVVPGGHAACTNPSGQFVPRLIEACREVADRAISQANMTLCIA